MRSHHIPSPILIPSLHPILISITIFVPIPPLPPSHPVPTLSNPVPSHSIPSPCYILASNCSSYSSCPITSYRFPIPIPIPPMPFPSFPAPSHRSMLHPHFHPPLSLRLHLHLHLPLIPSHPTHTLTLHPSSAQRTLPSTKASTRSPQSRPWDSWTHFYPWVGADPRSNQDAGMGALPEATSSALPSPSHESRGSPIIPPSYNSMVGFGLTQRVPSTSPQEETPTSIPTEAPFRAGKPLWGAMELSLTFPTWKQSSAERATRRPGL